MIARRDPLSDTRGGLPRQASRDNPPVLLQCGHALCQQSLRKLARGAGRFKYPYCPMEASPPPSY